MNQSPLAEKHTDLGARMVEFAGWEMPIQYDGIVAEHLAVRESVGVFDISHMGQIIVSGSAVGDWLNSLLTNNVATLENGEGQYTLMLNEKGGVIDDLIIYREAADHFFLVVNASKIDEDRQWLTSHLTSGISLHDQSADFGGLAIQGPDSEKLWNSLETGSPLPERNGILRTGKIIVCRTGYTGEDGFELFAPTDEIGGWFDKILAAGAKPCGLGARDSLRLEKCYPLNGNDLDPDHTPLEAGLGFFVKLKTDIAFTGRTVLESQKAEGLKEKLVAIELIGKTPPPRHGYEVIDPSTGQIITQLSSGGQSPSLGKGIALAYLPVTLAEPGTELVVAVRNRQFPARVVKKPFLK